MRRISPGSSFGNAKHFLPRQAPSSGMFHSRMSLSKPLAAFAVFSIIVITIILYHFQRFLAAIARGMFKPARALHFARAEARRAEARLWAQWTTLRNFHLSPLRALRPPQSLCAASFCIASYSSARRPVRPGGRAAARLSRRSWLWRYHRFNLHAVSSTANGIVRSTAAIATAKAAINAR